MGDGCDGVTIGGKTPVTVRFLTVTSSPPTRIVTVSEGHGNHYKRVPGRGVVRRQRGSAPSPSESPRYFAATRDESTIVGYYTLKKCRSLNRNPKFTADIQQKGAIWQETTGLTVPLRETVI